jgi:hypothetical protein
MSEGPRPQQRYCTNCGAEIRPGNTFCVSCGQSLYAGDEDRIDTKTGPASGGATSRGAGLLQPDEVRPVLYIAGAALSLVVTYLLLAYSVVLGILWIGLLVLAIAIVRRTRGTQTRLEQQAFERAGHYRESAQRAYEEGKHREIAQSAYQQSRKAYEETHARVRQDGFVLTHLAAFSHPYSS